jgi:hypothetical protein
MNFVVYPMILQIINLLIEYVKHILHNKFLIYLLFCFLYHRTTFLKLLLCNFTDGNDPNG